MRILGIDIGANNIKLVALSEEQDGLAMKQVQVRRHSSQRLGDDLAYCIEYLNRMFYDAVYVVNSVTGYNRDNQRGLASLNNWLRGAFPETPVYHLTAEGNCVRIEDTDNHPVYSFMGTNFYPSAFIASKVVEEGILVDIGTSSTDIIAIKNGKPHVIALDRPDYNRLATGELKFSGSLYTPLEYLAQEVPFRGVMTAICPGVAWTGHVYAHLGYITPELMQEHFKTPWGYEDAHHRLARYMCYDHLLVSEEETTNIANYLQKKQVEMTKASLLQVAEGAGLKREGLTVVALGLGTQLIIKPVADELGMSLIAMDDAIPNGTKNALSGVGTALAGWEHATGTSVSLSDLSQVRIEAEAELHV